jgi:thioredoxin reductase (NADPH)
VVEEITGNGVMESVRVKNLKTGDVYDYPAAAAFIYIGFTSNSDFLQGQVPIDETGHIYVDANMRTSIPGVYAAGDIRVDSYRQLGTAVGDGISAALSAYRDLSQG